MENIFWPAKYSEEEKNNRKNFEMFSLRYFTGYITSSSDIPASNDHVEEHKNPRQVHRLHKTQHKTARK